MVSEAQKKATYKWESKAYDKVLVRLPKGKKEEIQNACLLTGESLNGFIAQAIEDRLKR